ncbi:MAG: alcohol dehydrogenase catalytic domain-containing protein, partial [Clostridia bacterium]|nr:alcohol dehydrogenase catalytic domain-containing protein [Clostridia bacterium]
MNISSSQVESIVRKILGELDTSSIKKSPSVGATAKVAMLTAPKKIEVKEFPIPTVGDNDILVKVEGCGVCGTDVHEWKGDPFGIIPVTLGHEGTGEIVALGKNIKADTAGNPIKVGDKIVTSVISCGECF